MYAWRRVIQAATSAKKATFGNKYRRGASMEDVRCSTVRIVVNQELRGVISASTASTSIH